MSKYNMDDQLCSLIEDFIHENKETDDEVINVFIEFLESKLQKKRIVDKLNKQSKEEGGVNPFLYIQMSILDSYTAVIESKMSQLEADIDELMSSYIKKESLN